VWAPHAKYVSVVGNFNHWQGSDHQMEKQAETGVWSLFIPALDEGEVYKYEIETITGERLQKADPFAFYSELRPNTASVVYELAGYLWQDEVWCAQRKQVPDHPALIYEVHLGSWKRKEDGGFYTYRELVDDLVPYLQEMGFTHLELLPIMEHPFDGSWGYQVTGYYAATSRFGTPHDLMYLVDRCHQAGIFVILDWVPGHFCKDTHGLARFDGTYLFEDEEHDEWGTYKFDFSRTEVWSFLISNALFWLDCFHFDGLRVDGVTSMLFRNHGTREQRRRTNLLGKFENDDAVTFIRTLNSVVFQYHPDVLMIAEESSDWPLVSRPSYDGGLGFSYKWNMGWMNDTLRYIKTPFQQRGSVHQLLTFSLMYAFSENFILPFSHDEVVHGKRSMINRMPGDYWQKFAGLRTLYLYLLCHPGKKLLFMGAEIGQFIEWRENSELDWFLLDYEAHRKHQHYVMEANRLYQSEKSLWQVDHEWPGFEWIDVHNYQQSIISFVRQGHCKKEFLIIILNFQPHSYTDFWLGVPESGIYEEIFNTDRTEYGGAGRGNPWPIPSKPVTMHDRENAICCAVPPLGGVIFKRIPTYI
jgi:1,4-alpha-glucan branching enzyme